MPVQVSGATRLSKAAQMKVKSLAKAFRQLFNLAASDYQQGAGKVLNEDQLAYIAFQTAIAYTGQPYSVGYGQVKWNSVFNFAVWWLAQGQD